MLSTHAALPFIPSLDIYPDYTTAVRRYLRTPPDIDGLRDCVGPHYNISLLEGYSSKDPFPSIHVLRCPGWALPLRTWIGHSQLGVFWLDRVLTVAEKGFVEVAGWSCSADFQGSPDDGYRVDIIPADFLIAPSNLLIPRRWKWLARIPRLARACLRPPLYATCLYRLFSELFSLFFFSQRMRFLYPGQGLQIWVQEQVVEHEVLSFADIAPPVSPTFQQLDRVMSIEERRVAESA